MINAAYRTADVFVLSAKVETQPLAILDAMAQGFHLFPPTRDVCRIPRPGSSSGRKTTQAIHQLLDDANLRRALGMKDGRCQVKHDWNRVIDAYESLFERLLTS